MSDVIHHPDHYTSHPSGIEVIEITKHETFLRGNIIKYVLRAPYKGTELQDLRKSRQYLDWEIERLEKEEADDGVVEVDIAPDMGAFTQRMRTILHGGNPNHTGDSFFPARGGYLA